MVRLFFAFSAVASFLLCRRAERGQRGGGSTGARRVHCLVVSRKSQAGNRQALRELCHGACRELRFSVILQTGGTVDCDESEPSTDRLRRRAARPEEEERASNGTGRSQPLHRWWLHEQRRAGQEHGRWWDGWAVRRRQSGG